MRVLSPKTGRTLRTFPYPGSSRAELVFSRTGSHLLIHSMRGACVFEVATGKMTHAIDIDAALEGAAISTSHVAFGSALTNGCRIELRNLATDEPLTYETNLAGCGALAVGELASSRS